LFKLTIGQKDLESCTPQFWKYKRCLHNQNVSCINDSVHYNTNYNYSWLEASTVISALVTCPEVLGSIICTIMNSHCGDFNKYSFWGNRWICNQSSLSGFKKKCPLCFVNFTTEYFEIILRSFMRLLLYLLC